MTTYTARPQAATSGLGGSDVAGQGTTSAAAKRVWLDGPAVDLLVGCAGWSAPLLILSFFLARSGAAVSVAFYALALLFNYPHYMATIYRAYRTPEDFSRYRIFTLHLTLLLILTGMVAHFQPRLIPWIFTIYITWSPWHYSGQNFGLAMMFTRRAGLKPSKAERNALYTSFMASYGVIFLTFHRGYSADPYVLSLGLPAGLADVGRAILTAVFLLTGLWALMRLARRGGSYRTILAPGMLFATQFMWFVLPFFVEVCFKVMIPQIRYSSGILAVMHSAQYLWITSFYARREAAASGTTQWRARKYFLALIIGGIALFIPGPWAISYLFRFDFASSILIFTAIVNIHHFMLDGAIWKLRDPRISSLLVSQPKKIASSIWGQVGRLASLGAIGRRAAAVAVALLIVLAGVDQARYFFAAHAGALPQLSRAAALNPYDFSIHVHIADVDAASGNLDGAIVELQRAVHLNPYDPVTRGTLIRLLIQSKRPEDAYQEYSRLAPYIKDDPDSLINFGILANSLGHHDEAIEHWKRALDLAPGEANAHRYLADAYFDEGRRADAIPHYERYLAMIQSIPDQELDPKTVVGTAIRLGAAYADSNVDRALSYYIKAAGLAGRAGLKTLESLALEGQGDLYARSSRYRKAAQCYKVALQLDDEAKDDRATGMDWFVYAQLLSDFRSQPKMEMACLLKAEGLLRSTPGPDLDRVRHDRMVVETTLGAEAAEDVRRNQETLVKEALDFKF